MIILSYVGTLLLGVGIGYWLNSKREPDVIERHWVGFNVQKRLHYKHIHDYISKN